MKEVTTLLSVRPAGRTTRRAFRLFVEAARKLQQIPGFVAIQGFRALDASDDLFLVLDWNPTAPGCAMELAICSLVRQAERQGLELGPLEFLEPDHDRTLVHGGGIASLLRVAVSDGPQDAARESEQALKAIAAPGTTRVRGTRSDDGSVTATRIEFDTEDGLWSFLDSDVCRRWRGDGELERETWAINLPHLERISRPSDAPDAIPLRSEEHLSVQFAWGEDGVSAHLRLQGNVDQRGCESTERFCAALIRRGCSELRVDVSDLSGISTETLLMLARTARTLKERGGSFTLIDNDRRVRRITRAKQLESALI